MPKVLPGTTIELDTESWADADKVFLPMFLTGGLVLSQVAGLTGLETHVIQNWVRRGFLSPPVRKKYTRRQLSRILIINMLRDSMQMDRICQLLGYVNGELSSEADDAIDDSKLYLYLVTLCSKQEGEMDYEALLSDYIEPFSGAKARIKKALHIMVISYKAAQLMQLADELTADLDL